MVGYLFLGQRQPGQSWAARVLGTGLLWPRNKINQPASLGANLALRLLQVHVAIVIVASGLHKLQFGDWWAGVALWYPLYPPFEATLAQVRTHAPYAGLYLTVLSLAGYATLAWQIGFPLFAWRPRWRLVLLGGAALGWLGTAFLSQLPLLGPAILIGSLSYLTPVEWQRLRAGLVWVLGLAGWTRRAAVQPETQRKRGTKREEVVACAAGRQP
jgi:hypothetical protein